MDDARENFAAKEAAEVPAPYAAGTGSVPVGVDHVAFERMSYRERLAFKRGDPEGYRAAKAGLCCSFDFACAACGGRHHAAASLVFNSKRSYTLPFGTPKGSEKGPATFDSAGGPTKGLLAPWNPKAVVEK